jgi:CHAD domain-containing protein
MSDEVREGEVLLMHLRGLLDKRLRQLVHSRHFTHADDPAEAVHDLRVASRRLRAFGDVFHGVLGGKAHKRTDRALKRVTQAAGAIRDSDVQIALIENRRAVATTEMERVALEYLLEHLERARDLATRRGKEKLRKTDFEALCSSVRTTFEEAIAALPERAPSQRLLAKELLNAFVAKAESALPPEDGAEHAGEMHRLRIALKKLRYALELFEPGLGASYDALSARAVALQELLGNHHDLVVLSGLVEEQASGLEAKQRMALAAGMKMVEGTLASEREALVGRFRAEGFDAAWWRAGVRGGTDEG